MPRKPKGNTGKQPMVREGVAAYEVRSMAEVFWTAFQSLTHEQKGAFIEKLLNDPEWYDEIADAVVAIEGRSQPSRPYEEFAEELRRAGRL